MQPFPLVLGSVSCSGETGHQDAGGKDKSIPPAQTLSCRFGACQVPVAMCFLAAWLPLLPLTPETPVGWQCGKHRAMITRDLCVVLGEGDHLVPACFDFVLTLSSVSKQLCFRIIRLCWK